MTFDVTLDITAEEIKAFREEMIDRGYESTTLTDVESYILELLSNDGYYWWKDILSDIKIRIEE